MKAAIERAIDSPHPELDLARSPRALLDNPGTMLALLSERRFLGAPCSLALLSEGVRQCQEVRWKCESKVLQTHHTPRLTSLCTRHTRVPLHCCTAPGRGCCGNAFPQAGAALALKERATMQK